MELNCHGHGLLHRVRVRGWSRVRVRAGSGWLAYDVGPCRVWNGEWRGGEGGGGYAGFEKLM
jgi:hypothetical protein